MKSNIRIVLAPAFLLVFLVVGFPYWQISYSRLSLPSSLYGWSLMVVFVVAAVLRMTFRTSFVQAFGAAGLAVPAAVAARVVADIFQDSTSHNLWPIEIIIASGIGFSVALAGACLGGLVVFLLDRVGR
jgi:hypothetical protein